MPTADAHLHLFANGFCGPAGPHVGDELEVYERLRIHHGIERGLVVGYEGESRYRRNNQHVLDLARTRSWIVPLAYLSIAFEPRVSQLRRWRARGAAGVALYVARADDATALATWSRAPLDELSAQRAIVSINAVPEALELLGAVVDRLDGCVVLFSHLGLPGRQQRTPSPARARARLRPLLSLAARSHVGVKLSGLYAINEPPYAFPHGAAQPFVDVVLDAYGPGRLLWGSDYSPALDFVSFAHAADAGPLGACSAGEVRQVMGDNLLRLLEERSL